MTDQDSVKRGQIAERLKEARRLAGLSQGHVARILGLHRPSVSEMEAGNRRVSAEELGNEVLALGLLRSCVHRSRPPDVRSRVVCVY